MKKKFAKNGFTLIELLVVVLIVGILAAVSLPHYRLAVAKSRMGAHLPFMRTLQASQQRYYMENGVYSQDIRDLDISCPFYGSGSTEKYCYLDAEGRVYVYIAPDSGYMILRDGRVLESMSLLFYFTGPSSCIAYDEGDFEFGKRICGALTGDKEPDGRFPGWSGLEYKFK